METFPWKLIGEPEPEGVVVEDFVDTIKTPYSGGYTAHRPRNSAVLKRFTFTWSGMEPDEWMKLVAFWRVMGSSEIFYMQFPYTFFLDSADNDFGGADTPPVDFDPNVSFGSDNYFNVLFEEDSLKYKRISKLWNAEVTMIEAFSATIRYIPT